ncbi:hypothetical protein NPIL_415961 [Nephila pilipes]|uniref:Uncharacterized protein n=1 Tax=Nephila pilipes TaxID=299642 RepID=A0A8X6QVQ8_NEPPI|nr:hypothetical protein NPIL_415961 [Nephila pilipes]
MCFLAPFFFVNWNPQILVQSLLRRAYSQKNNFRFQSLKCMCCMSLSVEVHGWQEDKNDLPQVGCDSACGQSCEAVVTVKESLPGRVPQVLFHLLLFLKFSHEGLFLAPLKTLFVAHLEYQISSLGCLAVQRLDMDLSLKCKSDWRNSVSVMENPHLTAVIPTLPS